MSLHVNALDYKSTKSRGRRITVAIVFNGSHYEWQA